MMANDAGTSARSWMNKQDTPEGVYSTGMARSLSTGLRKSIVLANEVSGNVHRRLGCIRYIIDESHIVLTRIVFIRFSCAHVVRYGLLY